MGWFRLGVVEQGRLSFREERQHGGGALFAGPSIVILSPEACSNVQQAFRITAPRVWFGGTGERRLARTPVAAPQDPATAEGSPLLAAAAAAAVRAAPGRPLVDPSDGAQVCVGSRAALGGVAAVWKEFDTQLSRVFSLLDLFFFKSRYSSFTSKYALLK